MKNNVYDLLIQSAYDVWVGSDEYFRQSSLENGVYDEQMTKITKSIGKKSYEAIADCICGVACEVEMTGFEYGFRAGVKFWLGIEGETV